VLESWPDPGAEGTYPNRTGAMPSTQHGRLWPQRLFMVCWISFRRRRLRKASDLGVVRCEVAPYSVHTPPRSLHHR